MINGETLIQNINRNEIIVCDWDGVIQDVDILWMAKLVEQKEHFEKYLDFKKLTNEKGEYDLFIIHSRDTYYMDTWLKKVNVIPDHIKKDFVNLYMDDIIFYEKCPFLTMANGIKALIKEDFVKEIHFLSSAPIGIETDPRKIVMMRKFFGDSPKLRIDVISGNKKKSDFIRENIPNYTTFIDDRSDTIRDVVENTDSTNKQFILPFYKYNMELSQDTEYIQKCQKKGIVFSTYQNEIINV